MNALFLKILNMSIVGSWLILAVVLVRPLMKKAPKWACCLLWALVAIRLVCPVSFESAFSLIPSSETIPSNIAMAQNPAIHSGIPAINDVANPILADSFTPAPDTSANPLQIIIPIAAAIWLAGIAAMLFYALISYLKLKKSVSVSVPIGDRIMACDEVKSPFILGVFTPLIFVPSSMSGQTLEHVIHHETAHIKRHDHWWKPLGFLLLSIYWFNPLCWVAYVLLCRDIEMACDERVIRDMSRESVAAYSQALLDCSLSRRRITACPLAFGEIGVKTRIKAVLNYKKPVFWVSVAAVITCIIVAACFLTNPKNDEPDLSFLNYKNAISLIGQNGIQYAINYPAGESVIQAGDADNRELIDYLEKADWSQTNRQYDLASLGFVQFVIREGYRITVYQKPRVARVDFEESSRYYRIGRNDYNSALSLFRPGAPASVTFYGEIVEIDTTISKHPLYLVEVTEGSAIFATGTKVFVPLQNAEPSPEPRIGDILEVTFSGYVKETDPAQLQEVFSMRVVRDGGWDKRPMLYMEGDYYVDPYMPMSYLPHGYSLAGKLTEEQANNTGLEGTEYYTNPNEPSDFYTYQLCGTPVGINTVDSENLNWQYLRWIKLNAEEDTTRRLSLDDVKLLAEKGDSLTWEDFDLFSYEEIGSGLYIRQYVIDDLFDLIIGGSSQETKPTYIQLRNIETDAFIDIRTENVEMFIGNLSTPSDTVNE